MAAKGKVTIRGRFPVGTKVELHDRGSSDVFNGAGDPVARATTDRNGETTFSAPFGNYFAVAKVKDWNHVTGRHEDRVRAVDVSIHPEPAAEEAPLEIGPEPPSPSFNEGGRIVVGARLTADLRDPTTPNTQIVDERVGTVQTFASPVVGHEFKASEIPKDGQVPAQRQEDNRGAKLASATLTGEAVPPMGQPIRQDEAPKGIAQASDTEEGIVVPAVESVRQEDVPKGLKQASATPTGVATPIGDPDPREQPIGKNVEAPAVKQKQKGRGKAVKRSGQPRRALKKAKGQSQRGAKKAAKKQTAANRSRTVKAGVKRAAGAPETQRSRADTTAASQPTKDARGVKHAQ